MTINSDVVESLSYQGILILKKSGGSWIKLQLMFLYFILICCVKHSELLETDILTQLGNEYRHSVATGPEKDIAIQAKQI